MDGHRLETRPWWYDGSGIPVTLVNFTKAKYNWGDTYCMFRCFGHPARPKWDVWLPKLKITNIFQSLIGGLEHACYCSIQLGIIIPTDELHHFSEGKVYHQPVKIWPFQEVSLKWWYPLKQSISSRWLVHFGGAPFMAPTIRTDPLVN